MLGGALCGAIDLQAPRPTATRESLLAGTKLTVHSSRVRDTYKRVLLYEAGHVDRSAGRDCLAEGSYQVLRRLSAGAFNSVAARPWSVGRLGFAEADNRISERGSDSRVGLAGDTAVVVRRVT